MRMQVILDSLFARPGSAPVWGGKKGEFRDWTTHGSERVLKSLSTRGPGRRDTLKLSQMVQVIKLFKRLKKFGLPVNPWGISAFTSNPRDKNPEISSKITWHF